MKKLLCIAFVLAAVGCVWEPFAMYDYKAIIEVTSPITAQTINSVVVVIDTFPIRDTFYLDTTYSINVTVSLKEQTGKKIRFESVGCDLFDSKGNNLGGVGGVQIIPPQTNEEVDSITQTLKLTLGDNDLYALDLANEAEKWNGGTGYLGFEATGKEIDHGLTVDCLMSYTPITVTRGSWRTITK